jgi:hypothetical protein
MVKILNELKISFLDNKNFQYEEFLKKEPFIPW